MIHYRSWIKFICEFDLVVKVWTLAGISPIAWRDLYNYFHTVDLSIYKEAVEELYRAQRNLLNQISWLKNTKLQRCIEPHGGKVMTVDVQVARFFAAGGGVDPEFELNIYLSSDVADPGSDEEIEGVQDVQEIQEMDSNDSGWGFYASERVRDLGEDY